MIKLISTDLDGCLLDENGNLPDLFFDVLKQLERRNIKFAVASGRSYPALSKIFNNDNSIFYICDNGAFIKFYDETEIFEIKREEVFKVIKTCESISNIKVLLCGPGGIYHLPCEEKYLNEISKYHINRVVVNDLYDVKDKIFRIAVCDLSNASLNSFPKLSEKFSKELAVQVSGKFWVDFMSMGVDKGKAVKKLKNKFNIKKEETMAFGDYYNDIPMLKEAKYSFVMKNANDDIKKFGNYIADSNSDNGVINAIYKYVL